MRIPNLERTPSLVQKIGLILIGTVIGAIIMTVITQENIQYLHDTVDQYEKQNQSLSDQLENSRKVRKSNQIITQTTIRWDDRQKELETSVLNELESRMREDLQVVVSKPVQLIEVYRSILDRKVYSDVNAQNYRIRVTMIGAVGSQLTVFVVAELWMTN
jgi:hypothetical protein